MVTEPPRRILYVFPHPDDESFGPALAIARQRRDGHRVDLLTLTRGGATKQRHRLGLSVAEMGRVRRGEMEAVADVLGLSSLTVLDLPDGGLKHLDPREVEAPIAEAVDRLAPEVLVTYAVHGISGHPDHLVTHAVVKRLFCDRRGRPGAPRRLALFTLLPPSEDQPDPMELDTSRPEEIGCAVEVDDQDEATARRALACYETYREVIAAHDPLARIGRRVVFELFGEAFEPPLGGIEERLPA
ncbi:MAG TPA: PIG-L deacetylase family protein [Thermoanaerobaculia bacterium]|nr:PIG-L deacetylase family protein [Thermoanaerobaculia bacterium]